MVKRLIVILCLAACTASAQMISVHPPVWVFRGGASASSLVLEYLYTGTMTNASGLVVDTSGAGNNGTPGAAGAQPTYAPATNTMSAHVSADSGDSITSVVSEAQVSYSFYALTNSTAWRLYLWTNGVTYVDGAAEAFTLADFITTNDGVTMTWMDGYTGLMDENKLWTDPVAPSNFPSSHTNHGWMAYDYDNRGEWSNSHVYAFEYDNPSDHGGKVAQHGTKGASGAAPTWASDGTNGYYDFDATDYITLPDSATLSPGLDDFGISMWFKVPSDGGGVRVLYWDYGSDPKNLIYADLTATDRYMDCHYRDSNANDASFTGTTSYDDNKWYHLVFQRVGVTCEVYVDKVLQGIGTNASLGNIAVGDGANPYIGASSAPNGFILGSMDEIRIYSNALSAVAITNMYDESFTRHPNP